MCGQYQKSLFFSSKAKGRSLNVTNVTSVTDVVSPDSRASQVLLQRC